MIKNPLVFFVMLLISSPLWAEEPQKAEKDWKGQLELGALLSSGNTDLKSFSFDRKFNYKPSLWNFIYRGELLYSTSDGEQNAGRYLNILRVERDLNDSFAVFLRYSFLRDRFSGIYSQHRLDSGLKWQFIQNDSHELLSDFGLGYSSDFLGPQGNDNYSFTSVSLEHIWKFSESQRLENTLLWDGKFHDLGDYNSKYLIAWSNTLSERYNLSIKCSFEWQYSHRPPAGSQSTNTLSKLSLLADL